MRKDATVFLSGKTAQNPSTHPAASNEDTFCSLVLERLKDADLLTAAAAGNKKENILG